MGFENEHNKPDLFQKRMNDFQSSEQLSFQQVSGGRQELSRLNLQIDLLKENHQQQINQMQSQRSQMQSQINQIQSQINQMQSQINQVNNQQQMHQQQTNEQLQSQQQQNNQIFDYLQKGYAVPYQSLNQEKQQRQEFQISQQSQNKLISQSKLEVEKIQSKLIQKSQQSENSQIRQAQLEIQRQPQLKQQFQQQQQQKEWKNQNLKCKISDSIKNFKKDSEVFHDLSLFPQTNTQSAHYSSDQILTKNMINQQSNRELPLEIAQHDRLNTSPFTGDRDQLIPILNDQVRVQIEEKNKVNLISKQSLNNQVSISDRFNLQTQANKTNPLNVLFGNYALRKHQQDSESQEKQNKTNNSDRWNTVHSLSESNNKTYESAHDQSISNTKIAIPLNQKHQQLSKMVEQNQSDQVQNSLMEQNSMFKPSSQGKRANLKK